MRSVLQLSSGDYRLYAGLISIRPFISYSILFSKKSRFPRRFAQNLINNGRSTTRFSR
jgi:hypothetical protein